MPTTLVVAALFLFFVLLLLIIWPKIQNFLMTTPKTIDLRSREAKKKKKKERGSFLSRIRRKGRNGKKEVHRPADRGAAVKRTKR